MAVNSSENLRDSKVNKREKTRLHFNEFTYTWTVERYTKFKNYTENVIIESPIIVVYNGDDKYEFQLLISTRKYNTTTRCNNFYLDVKVLSCSIDQTKCHVLRSVVTRDEIDYNLLDSVAYITENAIISNYTINPNDVFDICDVYGNLTVKCKFVFDNGRSHIEPQSPDFEAASALSQMSILDKYEELLNSGKFSDVTLVVGEKKFSAHKAVLASRSPVFSAMFEHKMLENKDNIVEITDVEPEIMTEVLRFIYASKVKSIKDSTANLLAAADKYQIEALRLMCEEVFIEKLDFDSLEEILKIVDRYETCQRLHDCVLKFLSFNGKDVVNWENFDRVMKTLSPSFLFEATKATMLKS